MHPRAIFVQLTTACNGRCVNCPHSFTYGAEGKHAKGQMPDEVWRALVGQIQTARYTGQIGMYLHHEPLLAPGLCDKIREIGNATKAHVTLSTNGSLLTPEMTQSLIDARPYKVHINVASADPAQYEDIMGLDYGTTFERIRGFIKAVRKRFAVVVQCPLLPGVDAGEMSRTFPGVSVNTREWATSRGGLLSDVSAAGKSTVFRFAAQCRQPLTNMNVLWDGAVIVCCQDWGHESKPDFPNILEQDLFQTYRELMLPIQREFNAGNYGRYSMCRLCAAEMGFGCKPTTS
jgi:hypothetical protein